MDQYSQDIDIAEGLSRLDINWKMKRYTWPTLRERFRNTVRTAESYAVYMSSPVDRQTEIKDIGGYVGGYVLPGRRTKLTVLTRSVLTLDLDYATPGAWSLFTFMYSNAAVMHTSHKHSPAAPRYRLIMPLSRDVTPIEYLAIGRRVAGNLGIDMFDNSGFQYERLMYWPSTSADAEYLYHTQDGAFLDADAVLRSYRDWTNVAEWPVGTGYDVERAEETRTAGDPTEKPGAIGAFCTVYTIAEAIARFLPDTYHMTDDPNRYTYAHGSTSKGFVIYDHVFCHSHHGTDPVGGKMVNAFDLVRIHRFGHLDVNCRPDTAVTALPSYAAMQEFAVKDEQVRRLIVNASIERGRASDVFKDFMLPEVIAQVGASIDEDQGNAEEWKGNLDVDRKGNIQPTINNVMLILDNDPWLRGRIAFNTFEQREVALQHLPWRKVETVNDMYLTDADDAGFRFYIEKVYNIASGGKIEDGLKLTMLKNQFHPVRDYLNSLLWDGVSRVDRLLIDYMGCEDNEYIRAVSRKVLCAAVARIYVPGIKFDSVPMLIGPEGKGKSTLFEKLAGVWFSDSFTDVKGKEAFEQIQGVWIVEIAEMAGFKRSDEDAVTHFISKKFDRYRVAYGRRVENYPRQCIFVATSNKDTPLTRVEGNRRFWPARILLQTPVFNYATLSPETAGQIWAEAIELWRAGEQLYMSEALELQAKEVQRDHLESDDREGQIEEFVNRLLPEEWEGMSPIQRRQWLEGGTVFGTGANTGTHIRGRVCAAEIWCELFGGDKKDMTAYNTKFIHTALKKLKGFALGKAKQHFQWYGKQTAYMRVEEIQVNA
jgi:predicted P-loop ATPase